MTDKMMRIAGRNAEEGTAKAIATTREGTVLTAKSKQQIFEHVMYHGDEMEISGSDTHDEDSFLQHNHFDERRLSFYPMNSFASALGSIRPKYGNRYRWTDAGTYTEKIVYAENYYDVPVTLGLYDKIHGYGGTVALFEVVLQPGEKKVFEPYEFPRLSMAYHNLIFQSTVQNLATSGNLIVVVRGRL